MFTGATIPRRIIQTSRHRELNPIERAAAKALQLLHPDWEYLFFDDMDIARFIRSEFPQYKSTFDAFPHNIQRIDFFRYLAVLHHGGFYFDLDVLVFEELTPLLSQPAVFPFEEITLNQFLRDDCGIDWEIGNYAFGATPGHPFLTAIVENCVRAQQDARWAEPMFRGIPSFFRARFEVLNTTGPGLVTRTLQEHSAHIESVTVIAPGNGVDLCDSRNWHRFGDYGVHLMHASWRQPDSYVRRKAALAWENWQRNRLLRRSRGREFSRPFGTTKLA